MPKQPRFSEHRLERLQGQLNEIDNEIKGAQERLEALRAKRVEVRRKIAEMSGGESK